MIPLDTVRTLVRDLLELDDAPSPDADLVEQIGLDLVDMLTIDLALQQRLNLRLDTRAWRSRGRVTLRALARYVDPTTPERLAS